eukprot:scaffold16698_cov56-Phaeocystis_antarctica.AAC.1
MGGRCAGSERGQEARASIFSVTLQRLGSGPGKAGSNPNPRLKVHGSSGASGGDGEGCGGLGGRKCGCGLPGGNGAFRVARSTGNHCGGHAPGWLISTSSLATLGGVMCEMNGAQNAAATPMRTSARELGAAFSAYKGEGAESGAGRERERPHETAVRATGDGQRRGQGGEAYCR